ncbi:MAG: RDD family protein [Ignavibacteriales bacterium]|nr:RDD family protein [Ignavibacteriales bacterium]
MSYAGFWKRFVAYVIDSILLVTIQFVILAPMLAVVGLGMFAHGLSDEFDPSVALIFAIVSAYLGIIFLSIFLQWLYFSLMESSSRGATIGKMVMGIRVTDMQGNRISFGRATGRYFGKILSSLVLMIGYIMAGFTERKQALHDLLANTLVINQRM